MKNIYENLKNLRKIHNFTQAEVAQRLQLSRSSYNAYEQNICEPNIKILSKLADFYHTSIDHIVGGETQILDLNGINTTKKKDYFGCFKHE